MEEYKIYENKQDCCGCGACVNICPKGAITLEKDNSGFTYPKIDPEKCIKCGLCKRTCAFRKELKINEVDTTYVAVSKDNQILNKSASGGVFATIAREIIKNNGVVFGCSMERKDGILTPKHIKVDNLDDLIKLQGSKYVQSVTNNIYKEVKEELESEKLVLFSGTPCQVAALYSFLRNKQYDNLYTIDIICHGVPSTKMFQDYISFLENKMNAKIIDFSFRDKTKGWGLFAKIKYIKNGKAKIKIIPSVESSYYQLFLDSIIYRENCYTCPYAGKKRVGDLTIGDYWGIENEHPDYIKSNNLEEEKGVSCVVVNNEHAKTLISNYCDELLLLESAFDKAARKNKQLNNPSKKTSKRDIVLSIYEKYGYNEVDKWYKKDKGIKLVIKKSWYKLPFKVRKTVKKIVKK